MIENKLKALKSWGCGWIYKFTLVAHAVKEHIWTSWKKYDGSLSVVIFFFSAWCEVTLLVMKVQPDIVFFLGSLFSTEPIWLLIVICLEIYICILIHRGYHIVVLQEYNIFVKQQADYLFPATVQCLMKLRNWKTKDRW